LIAFTLSSTDYQEKLQKLQQAKVPQTESINEATANDSKDEIRQNLESNLLNSVGCHVKYRKSAFASENLQYRISRRPG